MKNLSIFSKVLDFINKFKNQNKNNEKESFEYTKFNEFLYDVSTETEHKIVKHVIILCNKALLAYRQRIYLMRKLKEYNTRLKEVECYNSLSEKDADELKSLIEQFVSLTRERNILRYQLVDFDKGVNKLENIEEDAEEAVIRMRDAEYNQRIFKQDIGYLQMEKEDLKDEQGKLTFGLNFIYKFSIVMLLLFGVGTIVLAMSNIFSKQIIFFSLSIMAILVICIIAVVYFFRRKLTYELKINIKKQEKLVEILSKKNVMYSYYTNFLKYECNKFKVRNADMLAANLKEYDNYKHVTSRYDSIRNIMYQTQELLEKFLRDKKIDMDDVSIEKFANTISIDDKIEYCKEINLSKEDTQAKLNAVDEKLEIIWKQVTDIGKRDWSGKEIIENIMNAYLREVEKINVEIDVDESYNSQMEASLAGIGE